MLQLKNIVKNYPVGDQTVAALRGISLNFRKSEFVCILGPSGCGKTTLLNIIGGLDQYTDGDLVIDGRSTRDYRDGDWDVYRNRSIGFVFQSYNLIPHQTVLANVELALTLSGVGKAERRRRAIQALEEVGLGDQLNKKPNQMSGGQMQRVAIARALVNNPEILLADEPTGALDSETSIQIMELLQHVAEDRLVIMVTHNPDLAEQYATRTVRLLDGKVSDDSAPYDAQEQPAATGKKGKKKPMSQATAMSLSARNLMTKKGRTFLTAFAGSIGIIGIALILALSNGIQNYINRVQEETLSSYPITIEAERIDMGAMLTSFMGVREESAANEERDPNRVYSSTVMYDLINSMMNAEVQKNNLTAFKHFLDEGGNGIADLSTVHYSYDFAYRFYTEDENGGIIKSDVTSLIQNAMGMLYGGDYSSYFDSMGEMYNQMDVWEELLPGAEAEPLSEQVKKQYDLLYGTWPEQYNEVVLFVDEHNQLSDMMLYALGFISEEDMQENLQKLMKGENLEANVRSWSYDELCSMDFKLILPAECYQPDAAGGYTDVSENEAGLRYLYDNEEIGTKLKIVGIARPNEDTTAQMVSGAIGYLSSLTEHAILATEELPVVQAQLQDPTTDVFTGLPFETEDEAPLTEAEIAEEVAAYVQGLGNPGKAALYTAVMSQPTQEEVAAIVQQQMAELDRAAIEELITTQYSAQMGMDEERVAAYIAKMEDAELFAMVQDAIAQQVREQYAAAVSAELAQLTTEQLAGMADLALSGQGAALGVQPWTEAQLMWIFENQLPRRFAEGDADTNLDTLGYLDLESPSRISLYAVTFEDKDKIADLISEYNETADQDDEISYTDIVALLMSSVTRIINAISYVLIAFVAISLVVSSIMIGIITYISVLERTKEIGILRAIGASKKDISRVFNAETIIVGLGAGILGIVVTLLLCIPMNAIVHHATGIQSLSAKLPWLASVILILISVLLTFIAGLIPSRLAAKKDPVTALRTE